MLHRACVVFQSPLASVISAFLAAAQPVFPEEARSQLFNRYLMTGRMPFLAKVRYDEEPSRAYLHDLYGAILLKDVVRRKQLRDVDLLDRIVLFTMDRLDISDGTIRHFYLPDFLASNSVTGFPLR